jgi:uncharacterized damage-inducible protein DinB
MKYTQMLVDQLEGTRDWTLKLLADLDGDDWTFQPAEGMAHALWLCGHLSCAQDLLVFTRVLGRDAVLAEDFTSHFPIGSPVASTTDHQYPSSSAIRSTMDDMQKRTLAAIGDMTEGQLAEPAFAGDGTSVHPHYRTKGGAIAHLNRHEAFHAGQISSLRRLLGKSFLR